MKHLKYAASLVALAGLTLLLAAPADAQQQQRQRRLSVEQPVKTIYNTPSGRRIVVVHPRSYLDAGTSLSRGDRTYHDYARPPHYLPYDRNDWKTSWSRMPFPDCFDSGDFCR